MNDPRDLTKQLAGLLRREHGALGDFLVALAEFDRERRWLELGHASLFSFLHRELGLSKGAAFYRKTATELVERYPEIVGPLRDGRLCITSVVELAKVITPANKGEVVPRFFHAWKSEAKAISAELLPAQAAPHRDVMTVVRPAAAAVVAKPTLAAPLLASQAGGTMLAEPVRLDEPRPEIPTLPPAPPSSSTPPAVRRDEAEPLTAELRRLHVTVSRGFVAKLAAARDALSHGHPGATTEVVLEAALDLLLAAHEKRKGLVKTPRRSPPQPSTSPRHVPAEVKRAVWTRDEGKCQWPLASGGICGSTTRLELDHVVPLARGGASNASNVRVLCRIHNGLAARRAFGETWMDRFTARAGIDASRQTPDEEEAPLDGR
jgi:hypothetical protein